MNALFFYARLLLREGELESNGVGKTQKQTQAFEFLSVIVQHPATWQVIRERANHVKSELASVLPENITTTFTVLPNWQEWARQFIRGLGDLD
jgi:hypothetical protein